MTINPTYNKAFEILAELVRLTNSSNEEFDEATKDETFELSEKVDMTFKTDDFMYAHPELRRGRDSNSRWYCYHSGFQDRRTRPLCDLSLPLHYIIPNVAWRVFS